MAIKVKYLSLQPYESVWQAMQSFTDQREANTPDEIWFVEHPPVFTQGLNGKSEHIIAMQDSIPLVQTDRGGQVTYHGPGQLIIYLMIDLKRARLGVRDLVHRLEKATVNLLLDYGIEAHPRKDAPGVYANKQKIASLGLKVRKHRTYHGLSINVNMDLTPFDWIHPCGLKNMQMTQLSNFIPNMTMEEVEQKMLLHLLDILKPEVQV